MDGLVEVQRDAGVSGDDAGDLLHAERDCRVVVTLAERRNHHAADIAHLGVVEDALEPVADFDSIFPRVHHDEHQDAAVSSLRAYLPLLFERCGKLVDRLVVVERFYCDYGDLGVCLTIDLRAEIFEVEFGGRRHDAGEVIDIAGGSRKAVHRFGRQDD